MNKTNDVQKVRRSEQGSTQGRIGPVYISAPLLLEEGFIKKSVSRTWWRACLRASVHKCMGAPARAAHARKIICVCSVEEISSIIYRQNSLIGIKFLNGVKCCGAVSCGLPRVCTVTSATPAAVAVLCCAV